MKSALLSRLLYIFPGCGCNVLLQHLQPAPVWKLQRSYPQGQDVLTAWNCFPGQAHQGSPQKVWYALCFGTKLWWNCFSLCRYQWSYALGLYTALHEELYIMFSTEKKSMLCINCFRDMPVWVQFFSLIGVYDFLKIIIKLFCGDCMYRESRAHCIDIETAYMQGCEKLDQAVLVRSLKSLLYTEYSSIVRSYILY